MANISAATTRLFGTIDILHVTDKPSKKPIGAKASQGLLRTAICMHNYFAPMLLPEHRKTVTRATWLTIDIQLNLVKRSCVKRGIVLSAGVAGITNLVARMFTRATRRRPLVTAGGHSTCRILPVLRDLVTADAATLGAAFRDVTIAAAHRCIVQMKLSPYCLEESEEPGWLLETPGWQRSPPG